MTESADLVSIDEADELLRRLDSCWTKVVRGIDESPIESVWQMVDKLRPHILQGASVGESWHRQSIESVKLYLENSEGLFFAFLTALGYAAELRIQLERGPVQRNSKLATRAFEMVDEAWDRLLGAGREKRAVRASRGGIARAEKQYGSEKAVVLHQLRTNAWKTIAEAARAIDRLLPDQVADTRFSNRVSRIQEWISSDPELRAAYDEGRGH